MLLQGLPFCMAGTGDLLALFRCISCRYGFGTDASCPELLGGPGRVFTSGTVCSLKGLTSLIFSVYAWCLLSTCSYLLHICCKV